MQEASGDVVVEVGEAEGDAAQVFEPAVDGLGGSVAGELVVEEGQDIRQAAFEGARQGPQLTGRIGGACVDAVDELVHHAARLAPVGFGVAGDDLLVDAPQDFGHNQTVTFQCQEDSCSFHTISCTQALG